MTEEIKKEVITFRIERKCANCNTGTMSPHGIIFPIYPKLYGHMCNICFYKESYYDSYPKIVYEDKK